MLPDEECIEIIVGNNNEGETVRRPDEEDPRDKSVEILPGFEVIQERHVKDVKVLLVKDRVALKLFTVGLPLLWSDFDIIRVILPSDEIVKDELGYKHLEGRFERNLELIEAENRNYNYVLSLHSAVERVVVPEPRRPPTVESFEDCQVVEHVENRVVTPKTPPPPVQCSTPKSVDSQETYFEAAEERKDVPQEDDQFLPCLDEKNDIDLSKKKYQNHDDLLGLSRDDDDQDKTMRDADEEIRVEKNPFEIDTSKFYSSKTSLNEHNASVSSQKTIQLTESPILSGPRSLRSTQSPKNVILAVYDSITIYAENYKCLGEGEYLNDVIIEFYLKYLMNEVLSEEDKNRTHIFSSQFFTRLSKPLVANSDEEVDMTESERRHVGVKNWTKNINIFDKDFVVVIINEHQHWSLAIICYPYLVGLEDDDAETLHRPCILFFDSLSSRRKDRIAAILRGYLKQEHFAKYSVEKSFTNTVLKTIYPKVPKQSNATDCGLYVLQYVEQFFKCPIMDFTVPLDLSGWFKRSVIHNKRGEIASLIVELASNYNAGKKVAIPRLQFPSAYISSDEENVYSPKRKNPFYKDKYPGFGTNNSAEGCSSSASKKKKSDQSSLDDWVRDAPPSNEQHLDLEASKDQDDKNNLLMGVDEDDVLIDKHNTIQSDSTKSPLSLTSSVRKYGKIGVMTENFSGRKSHIFQKLSIYSDESEKPSRGGTRQNQKRECQTKTRADKMMKLRNEFKERKERKLSKVERDSEDGKTTSKWIDDSDFQPSDKFYKYALFNPHDELKISPSVSYKQFKFHKKITQG